MFSFRAYYSLYRLVVFFINNKGRGKYATGFRQSNGLHVILSTILRTPITIAYVEKLSAQS